MSRGAEGRRYFVGDGSSSRPAVVRGDTVRLHGSGAGEGGAGAGTGPADSAGDPALGRIRGLARDGRVLVTLGGRSAVGFAERRDGWWHVELEGRAYRLRVDDERTHRLRALEGETAPAAAPRELRAPMPGLVVRIAVSPGEQVRAGDGLVVMEAMKMENELTAERAGLVAGVHVEVGATVERGALLVTFDSDAGNT